MALLSSNYRGGAARAALWLAAALVLVVPPAARVAALPPAAAAAGEAVPEYALKAAFLFNFAKYVSWPATAFAGPEAPIVVGVVGTDPFEAELERTFEGKTAQGRPFTLRRFKDARHVEPTHILFVTAPEAAHLDEVRSRVAGQPVFVVGEVEGLCRAGAAASIWVDGGRPRLELNPDAAARAGLTIDARLLRVGTVVREGKKG